MLKSSVRSEKEDFWRLVLEEWRGSGLSIKAFCEREDLSQPSFYSWRKKIEGRDLARDGAGNNGQPHLPELGPKFLPVNLIKDGDEEASQLKNLVEIITPGGMRLRFGESLSCERMSGVLASMLAAEGRVDRC